MRVIVSCTKVSAPSVLSLHHNYILLFGAIYLNYSLVPRPIFSKEQKGKKHGLVSIAGVYTAYISCVCDNTIHMNLSTRSNVLHKMLGERIKLTSHQNRSIWRRIGIQDLLIQAQQCIHDLQPCLVLVLQYNSWWNLSKWVWLLKLASSLALLRVSTFDSIHSDVAYTKANSCSKYTQALLQTRSKTVIQALRWVSIAKTWRNSRTKL